jgi:hypothetical protein
MPVSNPLHIPALIHLASGLQPRRVLDVGIGIGSLGLLLRQTLDICYGRIAPGSWQVIVEGVEIFDGYRNPVWDYAYSRIHMGDIRQILPTLPGYDLICCCDVLEHFEHNEAQRLIRSLLDHSRTLLATTPNILIPQDAWGGNEAERHLSVVTRGDFPGLALHQRGAATDLFVASADADTRHQLAGLGDTMPRTFAPAASALLPRLRRKLRRLFTDG